MQTKAIELTIVKGPVEEINQLHAEMNELAETAVQKAIRIGELLTEQKKLCKHGEWMSWLGKNVSFSRPTADNYRRLYNKRDKLLSVSNLGDAYRIVTPKDKPAKNKKQALGDDIVLQAHGARLILEKPIRPWHITYSGGSESIVCRQCWTHSSGGKNLGTLAKIKVGSWFYECKCSGSKRDAIEEEGK